MCPAELRQTPDARPEVTSSKTANSICSSAFSIGPSLTEEPPNAVGQIEGAGRVGFPLPMTLLRRWSKAKTDEGQVVLLSGEAGIGKSRLTAALLESLATEPHARLRYFCSPQHTDSALYPIIKQMERAAGFAHDDTTQAKLDKLDTLLAKSFAPPQDTALIAEMLSLPNDGQLFDASNWRPSNGGRRRWKR